MLENPEPTGSVTPTVTVVKPLNNNPPSQEEETLPPLIPTSTEKKSDEEELPPLTPQVNQQKKEDEKLPSLPSSNSNKSTFDFGQTIPIESDNKDTRAKQSQVLKKAPQELFPIQNASENTKVVAPIIDISKSTLNDAVNKKYLPNTGTVEIGATGAPVISKEDNSDIEKIANSSTPQNFDVTNSMLSGVVESSPGVVKQKPGVLAVNALSMLNAGKIITFSSMSEEQSSIFRTALNTDNAPKYKIVYPEVKTKDLNSTLSSLHQVDLDLDKKIQDENKLLEHVGEVSVDDPEAMQKVVNKIQGIRNASKYKVYENAGFVGSIPSDLPETIQDALRSQEYLNSTASDKKLYAKMLWFTNQDKFLTPEDLYSKISQTFTPSVAEQFIKQKAAENDLKMSEIQKRFSDIDPRNFKIISKEEALQSGYGNGQQNILGGIAGVGGINDIKRQADNIQKIRDLYSELKDADFENENSVGKKILFALKYHGKEAIPFYASIMKLDNSIDLYRIMNKAKISGIESLNTEDRALYDATEMLNSYYELSKPDKLTTAINNAPAFLAFLGELAVGAPVGEAIGGGVNAGVKTGVEVLKDAGKSASFAKSFLFGSASKTMKVAMTETPAITESFVNIVKAVDGITGGAMKVAAENITGKLARVAPVLGTTIMARHAEILDKTVKDLTQTPVNYIDWKTYQYIDKQLPANSQGFWQTLRKNTLLEAANIGAMELSGGIGRAQNDLVGSLMNRFPKESMERKVLGWLKANQNEELAESVGLETGVQSFLRRASFTGKTTLKSLSPATIVPDVISYGVVLPPVEATIEGKWKNYSDEIQKNPYKVLTNQIQSAAIGLAVPILGGKLFGLSNLINFDKIVSPNKYKFTEFRKSIYEATSEQFNDKDFITNLRNDADLFSKTGDNRKNYFGALMHAAITHRQDFEAGKIDGAVGETYKEYSDNLEKSQLTMNELLDRIKDGDVTEKFLQDAISSASDSDMKSQFQFHKDLVDSYEAVGNEGETLKQYVDKHKKEYDNIKQEFSVLRSLKTKPNWNVYEKRINDLLMPEVYKKELKSSFDELKFETEKENQKLYGNKVGDVTELQQTVDLSSPENSHKFTLNEDGTYKFTTSNEESAHNDIDFRLKSMSIPDIMNLYNVSRNSDMTVELKQKVSDSIKNRTIEEFSENEFFSQFGGRENMSQLLDAITTVSQSSPLTSEEKQNLSDAVMHVLEVEIRKDATEENYQRVKSTTLDLVRNADIINLADVLKFHTRSARTVMANALKEMSVADLEANIVTATDESDRQLLKTEVEERKNADLLTESDLKRLMHDLSLAPIQTNVDLEELRKRDTPAGRAVSKVLDKVYALHKEGRLTDNGITLIEGLLCGIDHRFFDAKSVVLSSVEGKEEDVVSKYSEKSKTITISQRKGASEATIISELQEEIWHNIEHNLATSTATGGMIGDFILTDAELEKICGENGVGAITTIAKWFKGKDYDYNRFLQLKGMTRSEMTDVEAKEYYDIKDMLERFSRKKGAVGTWDNMIFEDTENKINGVSQKYTTQQLVQNWNRYQQMRTATRPGGVKYSAAQAFYYSIASHEYFARNFADYQIKDIQSRLAGSPEVEKMIQKTGSFMSKIKLPGFLRMFRSEAFKGEEKKVTDLMTGQDEQTIKEYAESNGAPTAKMLEDYNNILKDTSKGESENHIEHFRNLVADKSNPGALNKFILDITNNAKRLGYDSNISGDILAYLNKEIAITPGKEINAFRSEEDEKRKEIKYVSNTLKALEGLKIDKTSGANWLDKILSSGGKKVEIERYGLDEFLKREKSPTKQDIIDFLSDKVMKVKDVVLGGEIDKEFSRMNAEEERLRNLLRIQGFEVSGVSSFSSEEVSRILSENGDSKEWSGNSKDYLSSENSEEENIEFVKKSLAIRKPEAVRVSGEKGLRTAAKNIVDKFNDWKIVQDKLLKFENKTEETRWSQYTTFPLNNYRELLPTIDTEKKLFEHTSHFPGIQNQLYHNRLNDVTTVDGKKLLLSEEMQGDWTQSDTDRTLQGERNLVVSEIKRHESILEGFKNKEYDLNELEKKEGKSLEEVTGKFEKDLKMYQDRLKSIDTMIKKKVSPYTKTSDWVRAAIKRMIALAVSEGKDGIAWTPAHLQVSRWTNATRDVVDKIDWNTQTDVPYGDIIQISGTKNGNDVIEYNFQKESDGIYRTYIGQQSGNTIRDIFGSEIEKKILEEPEGELSGDNIIVGGQGYIDIYDKTAVDVANKLAKKYGLTVGESVVEDKFSTEDLAHLINNERTKTTQKVHSLLFNDKLREDIASKNEIEIFAKQGDNEIPSVTPEFKNIPDFMEANKKIELEKEIHAYAGIEAFNNLEKTNPEEWKRLSSLLDDMKKRYNNPDDKSYITGNYLLNGWFREVLKGKEFLKFRIDDSKMSFKHNAPSYKSPETARGMENVARFLDGNRDSISRQTAEKDTDSISGHNIYLEEVINHKELFNAYPELRNAKVEYYWGDDKDLSYGFKYHATDGEARFALNVNRITSKDSTENAKDTLRHEVQHEIQRIEGFHRGSSEEYFKDNFFVYNVYQAKENGDQFVIDALSKPENKAIADLVEKISEGKEISKSEFNPKTFMTAKSFADSRIQILHYMKTKPEYKWAYDMYRNSIGEVEAFDVEQNKVGELPATALLSLGEVIKQNNYNELIRPQDVIPISGDDEVYSSNSDTSINAKKDDERWQSPVDVAWFKTLFTDKDTIISAKDIEKVIKDVDDNLTTYIDGDLIKTIPQARRAASKFASNLLDLWKQRLVQKALPKSSTYERSELLRLINTPVRNKLERYSKDIQYISDVVENANFRKLLTDTQREKGYARNRFLRYNKDDVEFYSAVNKLVGIDLRFFETQDKLSLYNELLTSKPENVNVGEFKEKVTGVWNEYLDWKKDFNEKYEYKTDDENVSEDESLLNEQLFYDKKQIIKEAVKTQLTNQGRSQLDKGYIDAFANIDVDQLNENEVKDYESALKYLLLNPTSVNHKVVQLVNKHNSKAWAEKVPDELSKKYVDLINSKALPSSGMIKNLMKGVLPGVSWNYDKLGNLAPYNVTSIFEIAEGMAHDNYGILRSEITEPINRNYQNFLVNKSDAIRTISAKDKYSIAQMHRIGIKALLDQKPQFGISANGLEVLSKEGIDISDIAKGDVLTNHETGSRKEAYEFILKSSNEMIKDSILISFGQKPDHEWKDDEMKEILGDVEVMSQRSQSQIAEELKDLLEYSGHNSLRELVDDIASGNHELTVPEQGYLDLLRETSNATANGDYSNGLSLKDASEKLQGVEFQSIENYAPLLRYKTYLTTEKYLGEESDNDSKIFYGIYNDFQMNTSFLEKRKPTVMALETNAYAMFAKRLDQQIYYLNNIEHQNYLKSVFRTPVFYGKGDVFNTEATNQIVEILNGNYNRGINAARAKVKQDISAKGVYGAMDRYKALAVGDWLKSPSQLTTIIFNMAKMKGNFVNKSNDIRQSLPVMVSSYMQGTPENVFLSKFAPEVYYRGLNTYDFMGIDSGDNYTQGESTEGKSKLGLIASEASRNSGKVSGVISGLERGMYRTNKSKAGVIASEVMNRYSQFGSEFNLSGLKFHDRVAARTSFFASYINFCKYKGIDVDYENPNQEALNFALESVRETQHTDNPLQRSGLSYGLNGSGTQSWIGDWQMVNMLAFKSYAINERQTLMKASERLKNAIAEGNKDKIIDESAYFAYSFASKVVFNYIKLYCQKYILALLASQVVGKDSDKKALADASIGNWAKLQNVGMRSMLDYFTLAEPLKFAASVLLSTGEATIQNSDLTPEEKEKYGNMNPDFMNSFSGDVLDNLISSGSQIKPTVKNYGFASREHAIEEARFWLLLSQMKLGIPGASVGTDLLKEADKQKKIKEKSKRSADNEDSGI